MHGRVIVQYLNITDKSSRTIGSKAAFKYGRSVWAPNPVWLLLVNLHFYELNSFKKFFSLIQIKYETESGHVQGTVNRARDPYLIEF